MARKHPLDQIGGDTQQSFLVSPVPCSMPSVTRQELWEEQRQIGKVPPPWPESTKLRCPAGFPASCVGDVVCAWSCLQLFGPLMHLRR